MDSAVASTSSDGNSRRDVLMDVKRGVRWRHGRTAVQVPVTYRYKRIRA